MEHTTDIRIYYEDTDAGGVVYHANYIAYGERVRAEFLRHIGHQSSTLAKDCGVTFVVKHIDIEYHKPAFLDDLLTVHTTITSMKNSSFTMHHQIKKNGEIITDLHVVLVCVDANTLKPVRIPEILRAEFEKLI
ncbi:MAG: tol-pal system-associated acyl-CoA thioesterase [Alphaproteobacteria bacterium]|nr:tol-pal system-associated acyl-CoA thioesterase [Alphaproteobacteria bacterium]